MVYRVSVRVRVRMVYRVSVQFPLLLQWKGASGNLSISAHNPKMKATYVKLPLTMQYIAFVHSIKCLQAHTNIQIQYILASCPKIFVSHTKQYIVNSV